jgi:hypothetical protein
MFLAVLWCNLSKLAVLWCNLSKLAVIWCNLSKLAVIWCSLSKLAVFWCNLSKLAVIWCNLFGDTAVPVVVTYALESNVNSMTAQNYKTLTVQTGLNQ